MAKQVSRVPVTSWMQLRFLFAAPSLRAAGDLAAALRRQNRNKVQIRQDGRRHWTIIATTSPTVPGKPMLALVAREMDELVERHPGCRIVGWMRVGDDAPA